VWKIRRWFRSSLTVFIIFSNWLTTTSKLFVQWLKNVAVSVGFSCSSWCICQYLSLALCKWTRYTCSSGSHEKSITASFSLQYILGPWVRLSLVTCILCHHCCSLVLRCICVPSEESCWGHTVVYLSLSGMAPAYLAADCQLVSNEGRHQLLSATSRMCVVRRTYSNYGDRCFAAAGPKLWNSLSNWTATSWH